MGKRQRCQNMAAIRRQDIMKAAWVLMESRGVLNVTMDEIARESEYTKQTVYSYFSCKDELLIAIHLERFQQRWGMHQEQMDAAPTGIGKLRAFSRSYYSYFTAHPTDLHLLIYIDFRGLYFSDIYKKLYAQNKEYYDFTEKYMQSVLRQAQKEGQVRSGLDLWWTLSYIYLSLRTNLNEIMMKKELSVAKRKELYFTFVDILLSGMSPTSEKGKYKNGKW
jgi:AcrR family transcriptional regulator